MKPLERLIYRVIGIGVVALAVTMLLALSSTPVAAENDTATTRENPSSRTVQAGAVSSRCAAVCLESRA